MKKIVLKNKKIAILGLGIENQALVMYVLKKKIKCEITICDKRDKKEFGSKYKKFKNLKWQLGKDFNKNLDKFDVLFRAPGWPIKCPGIQKALKRCKTELSSPMQLFMELCPTKNIIGVTGTKGKGTVSSLIYQILKKAGKQVWLGGNIGIAPFEFIEKIKKNDWVVLELSSFQLEDMTISPHIAVLNNFTREHLAPADPNNPNYHKSLKVYWEAKANIFKWQKKGDFLISNFEFLISKQILNSKFKTKGTIIYFNKSDLPSKLVGEHNKENIAAAVEVAKIVGVRDEVIKKAVASFKGLEHRIEFIGEVGAVKYYDDSFATIPESAIIALKSFISPIILLAGGADKGANFKQFAREIKRCVKFLVLLNGKATPRLKTELIKIGYPKNQMILVDDIKNAVIKAKQKALVGDIVLLSTGCASFGMFKNYKERGDLFKKEVMDLK
jgi:UDP-N-acetylmuramoylalanine--D-glutamate ligase